MVMATPHQNLVDSQSCKYNEVVCGGRSDKLILEKFHKLEGNKAYGKCVECNNKLQWNLLIRTLENVDTCIIQTPSCGLK